MVGAFSSQNLSSSVTHDRSRAILISSPTLMHSESWTTSSRYPEEPAGLLALDPQLVCYSWVTGIAEVAQVVFRAEAISRGSVPANYDHRRTTAGVGTSVYFVVLLFLYG